MPHPPMSYGSTQSALNLARRGINFTPSITFTLFQAEHSSAGKHREGNGNPSLKRSTMPRPLSAFSSQQAPMDRSSATQRFPISGDSMASQPVPDRCIADSDWSACVHRTGGDGPSDFRKPLAPISDRGQLSELPRQQTPQIATSTSEYSSNRPDLLPSDSPASSKESGPTLSPEDYEEWASQEISRGRRSEMSKG